MGSWSIVDARRHPFSFAPAKRLLRADLPIAARSRIHRYLPTAAVHGLVFTAGLTLPEPRPEPVDTSPDCTGVSFQCVSIYLKLCWRMASRKGVEPLTPGLGNLCSILLSYRDLAKPRSCPTRSLWTRARRAGKATSMDLAFAHRLWRQIVCASAGLALRLGVACLALGSGARVHADCGAPSGTGRVVAVDERLDIQIEDGRIVRLAGLEVARSRPGLARDLGRSPKISCRSSRWARGPTQIAGRRNGPVGKGARGSFDSEHL